MPKKWKHDYERCDRCGRTIRDRAGVARGEHGDHHLRPDEYFVCWGCLDADPYYQAEYLKCADTPDPK